jgi:fumarate hydratase class I
MYHKRALSQLEATMQPDLTDKILELIRRTSSSLPADVEKRLKASIEKEEPGSAARGALETIMKNIELSRQNSTPICQDTGTPIFYVYYPESWSTRKLREQVRAALAEATKRSYMRPNAVDAIYDKILAITWAATTSPTFILKKWTPSNH